MKTFTQNFSLSLLLLVAICLLPPRGLASENRVDATGGLTTVLLDETDNLDLFLDGNPAGLLLLSTRDRLDLSGEWSYSDQEGPWGSNKQQVLTTIPRYTDNPIKYEGLMVFPDPHWAVQVLGDVLINQGVSVNTMSNDTETTSQYRGLVRAAYALPFGVVGMEILDVESDSAFDPGLFNPYVGLASGWGAQNQWLLKTGFITTFPTPASPSDPRWQAGAYFQTQLGSSPFNQNWSVYYLNSPAFNVAKTTTLNDAYVWGAELLYELPPVIRLRFAASLTDTDSDFEQTVPYTSAYFSTLTRYHLAQFDAMNVNAAFKISLPLSDSENLKLGGLLGEYFFNQDLLRQNGVVYDNKDKQQVTVNLGIGLEIPKDYTLGLQWKSQNYANGANAISNTGTASTITTSDFEYYQLALGGEKWLSPTWALRMGFVEEIDVYNPSLSTLTMTLNAGAGWEGAFGRLDGRFWLGQTNGLEDSTNTMGLVGTEVSATIFL